MIIKGRQNCGVWLKLLMAPLTLLTGGIRPQQVTLARFRTSLPAPPLDPTIIKSFHHQYPTVTKQGLRCGLPRQKVPAEEMEQGGLERDVYSLPP